MNQSSGWENTWTFVSSPRWRFCCNFCSSLEISSKLWAGFFVSNLAGHICIVFIDALYTLYDYSTQSLIIITTRKILIFLWLILVISALLFAAQAAASSAWRIIDIPSDLLTSRATARWHRVPLSWGALWECDQKQFYDQDPSTLTSCQEWETRFKVLSGTHVRWDDAQDHAKTATTSYWHLNQYLLERADLQEPYNTWSRASENQHCDGTGQKTVDKWNNQDWIWWN